MQPTYNKCSALQQDTLPTHHFDDNIGKCQEISAVNALNQKATLLTGVILRVRIDKRYPIKMGTRVEGRLIDPVYQANYEALPVNTFVSGAIIAIRPICRATRINAILDGRFTPLTIPEVCFDQITLLDGTSQSISAQGVLHDGEGVCMSSSSKDSHEARTLEKATQPRSFARMLRAFYESLPYYPQLIWPGMQCNAILIAPLVLPVRHANPPIQPTNTEHLTNIIRARLTSEFSSSSAKQGQVIEAVLTRPLLSSIKRQTLLPEGTRLEGTILHAKPARWFALNGQLCFVFRRADLSKAGYLTPNQLAASEAICKESIPTAAFSDMHTAGGWKKYVIPLALGLIAVFTSFAYNYDFAKNSFLFNGLALMTHSPVISVMNRYMAVTFSYYALIRSLYRYWIAKGKEIAFSKDTLIEIETSEL